LNAPQSLRLIAPSRLHFGLIAWGEEAPRQFGSVGLMIEKPGLSIVARPSESWKVEGPLASRGRSAIDRILIQKIHQFINFSPLHMRIEFAPREHIGLGTGTQLSLAVARLVLHAVGESNPSIDRLAGLTGRGLRSGIGLHGFAQGGLIVDGGRSANSSFPPLLARFHLPSDWSILIVIPPVAAGLSDSRERDAFARLPDIPIRTIERLSRLVLLGLMPAVAEEDFPSFGVALTEIQRLVGRSFAPAQGGIFADPQSETIIAAMERLGLIGVGQSSWGPALYGFTLADEDQRLAMSQSLMHQFGLAIADVYWTRASNRGATIERISESEDV